MSPFSSALTESSSPWALVVTAPVSPVASSSLLAMYSTPEDGEPVAILWPRSCSTVWMSESVRTTMCR